MQKNSEGQIVAWLAIVVSLAAFVLAWFAWKGAPGFFPDSQSQEEKIKGEVLTQIHQEVAMGAAAAKLSMIQSQLSAGKPDYTQENAAKDVAAIRQNLQNSFTGTTGETYANWKKIDADLATLQSQLESKNPDYKTTIQKIISEINPAGQTNGQ